MPVNSDLTEAQVREFFTTLSNWGKWGPNDQLGALNYITPAKRAQAAALVREGYSVSMSLPLATQPGNLHDTRRRGAVDSFGAAHRGRCGPVRGGVHGVL